MKSKVSMIVIVVIGLMLLVGPATIGVKGFTTVRNENDNSPEKTPIMKVTLTLVSLGCLAVTDTGTILVPDDEDEVHLIVESWRGKDRQSSDWLPSGKGHWNLRKMGSVDNVVLWSGDIADGDTISVWVKGIDADGAFYKIQDVVSFTNEDDILGAFAVDLTNQKGKLLTQWLAGEAAQERPMTVTVGNRTYPDKKVKEFGLLGDGAHYLAYLRTDPVFE